MPLLSQNVASFDYFLVEKSLVAFEMFRGWFHASLLALRDLSLQVQLQPALFAVSQDPEPSDQQSSISDWSHVENWPHPLIPVVSIREASSASAENSAWVVVPFGRLCLSHIQRRNLGLVSPALYHPFHSPDLLHCRCCRTLQDCSDCLGWHATSLYICFRVLTLSI